MILKVLVYVNTALIVALLGGSFFGYRYVTSPQFEEQVKQKIIGQVSNVVPKSIEKSLPATTGISMPL